MMYSVITLYVGCGVLGHVWNELAYSSVQWCAFGYGDLNFEGFIYSKSERVGRGVLVCPDCTS